MSLLSVYVYFKVHEPGLCYLRLSRTKCTNQARIVYVWSERSTYRFWLKFFTTNFTRYRRIKAWDNKKYSKKSQDYVKMQNLIHEFIFNQWCSHSCYEQFFSICVQIFNIELIKINWFLRKIIGDGYYFGYHPNF